MKARPSERRRGRLCHPPRLGPDDAIEDSEQFPHTRDQGELPRLPGRDEPQIERTNEARTVSPTQMRLRSRRTMGRRNQAIAGTAALLTLPKASCERHHIHPMARPTLLSNAVPPAILRRDSRALADRN